MLAKRILAEIPGSSLNTDITPGASLPNILNASFRAAEGESIQLYLDAEGIIVSTRPNGENWRCGGGTFVDKVLFWAF